MIYIPLITPITPITPKKHGLTTNKTSGTIIHKSYSSNTGKYDSAYEVDSSYPCINDGIASGVTRRSTLFAGHDPLYCYSFTTATITDMFMWIKAGGREAFFYLYNTQYNKSFYVDFANFINIPSKE